MKYITISAFTESQDDDEEFSDSEDEYEFICTELTKIELPDDFTHPVLSPCGEHVLTVTEHEIKEMENK
ncbi:Oidioi.mRNA.OKI2018_I69.XSR.g14129.t1.cds [Oikopleura dioica]|uniref:Oidioi.mRNA.OKI2018_I69.XSR.g14129.t1.cds n=1 Tax=Oikopleura dioica TaxID=34765 RepID=A0ABN7SE49_OIKDI|nr:Oidioi.mRNA.OKI2018_I69.XSR.g14129.t1.cds [Oikopleura dioica]